MAEHALTHSDLTADELYELHSSSAFSIKTSEGEISQDEDEYFPLQPIEKKLCAASLGLGLTLLAFFVLVFEL